MILLILSRDCRTVGVHITVNGKKCINLATYNFLGFLGNTAIKVYTQPHYSKEKLLCIFNFFFSVVYNRMQLPRV
jgi:hypothetical protein